MKENSCRIPRITMWQLLYSHDKDCWKEIWIEIEKKAYGQAVDLKVQESIRLLVFITYNLYNFIFIFSKQFVIRSEIMEIIPTSQEISWTISSILSPSVDFSLIHWIPGSTVWRIPNRLSCQVLVHQITAALLRHIL